MHLKLVKSTLTREQAEFLKQLRQTEIQILARAAQLVCWGENKPDILSQDKADMLVAVGGKIKDLICMLLNDGAANDK